MSILPHTFADYETPIREAYGRARIDAGVADHTVELVLADLSTRKSCYESEFAALASPARVAITWNGLASLWACAQAVARILPPMFEAQRHAKSDKDHPPRLEITPEIETGFNAFELSLRLAKNRLDHWVEWAPKPSPSGTGPDRLGNFFFFGALAWIMRHELAHHVLGHHENPAGIPAESISQELEADAKATVWLKSDLEVDVRRAAGEKPSTIEVELERRALCMFVGLTWLMQFECIPHATSTTHPDASRRLDHMINHLDLADDSFAYEVMSYSIKALIDPEGSWPSDTERPSAKDALIDALVRLNRTIQEHS